MGEYKAPVKFDCDAPQTGNPAMEWDPSENTQILCTVSDGCCNLASCFCVSRNDVVHLFGLKSEKMGAVHDFDLGNTTFQPNSCSTINFTALSSRLASTPFHASSVGQPAPLPEPGLSFIKPQDPVVSEQQCETEPPVYDNTHESTHSA